MADELNDLREHKPTPKASSPTPTYEVSHGDQIDQIKNTVDTDLATIKDIKFKNPYNREALDKVGMPMLRKMGGLGQEAGHDLLPFIQDTVIAQGLETARVQPELIYGALAIDALSTSTPEDIDRTISVLRDVAKEPELLADGTSFYRSREYLCQTLVRQITELKESNPDSPEIDRIVTRLTELRDNPQTDSLLRDSALRLPLAAAGDPRVLQERDQKFYDIEINKYKDRRFNLSTLEFEYGKRGQAVTEPLSQQVEDVTPFTTDAEKLDEVRTQLEEVALPEDDISDAERLKREALERLRQPNAISSKDSAYSSNLAYEVPDPDRLLQYLTSGRRIEDQRQGEYNIGPKIGEMGGRPKLIYGQGGRIELELPIMTEDSIDLANVMAPQFLKTFQRIVNERGDLSEAASFTIDTQYMGHYLYRRENGRNDADQVASLRNGVLTINVHTLGKSSSSSVLEPEQFRVALRNALELHRILATEIHNEENGDRRDHKQEIRPMPHETVVIDSSWNKYPSSIQATLPQAA